VSVHPISGCEKAERKADVVFVHGLGGDAFETWRYGKDDSTSWPHWLGQEFSDVGVWSLGYAASPTKWLRLKSCFSKRFRDAGHGMALPDRALQLLDYMVQRGLGERPLLFICHSLGGLVTKQILRTSRDDTTGRLNQVFGNTRAVLFLATPHVGADLASLVGEFRVVFGATVTIQDLRAHDANLRNLYDWYREHAAAAGMQTFSYFEQRSVRGVTIVKPHFAHPGIGANPVALDEDHISIAKPRERSSQVCGAARQLLSQFVLASTVVPAAGPAAARGVAVSSQLGSTPVPHELPPNAAEFFGRRDELDRLIHRLRSGKDTAVVGEAGLGKTALAAKALLEVVGETHKTLADSPFPDGIVFLDLYVLRAAAESAWDSLANKLAGAGFMERSPARERAINACQSRRILLVIEGGEEADGRGDRTHIPELLSVLSPQNRWLLLTRLKTQAAEAESIVLSEALHPEDAARLFDALTLGRVSPVLRSRALELLEGHPLALTWASNLLVRDDDEPESLVTEWQAQQLPHLSDPRQAQHTLEWLFERSVRGLDDAAKQALAAAALLGGAPFPSEAIDAALRDSHGVEEQAGRRALRALAQRSLLRRTPQGQWQFTHVLGYRFARRETGSDAAVRMRLGEWLNEQLASALTVVPATVAHCPSPMR
jgi:hypothetical protein